MKIVHQAKIVHLTPGLAQHATLDNGTQVELDNPYVRRHRPKVNGTVIVFENCSLGYLPPEGEEVPVKQSKSRLEEVIETFPEDTHVAIRAHLDAAADPLHFIKYTEELTTEERDTFIEQMREETKVIINMKPGELEELMTLEAEEIEALAELSKEESDALLAHLAEMEERAVKKLKGDTKPGAAL